MSKYGEFDTVKETVRKVLSEDERARNSDKWLIIQTLRRMGFKIYIPYKDLQDMPSFETITRCRRKLQEDGKYLSSKETRMRRRQAEKEVRDWSRK